MRTIDLPDSKRFAHTMHHSDGDALWVLSIKGDPQDVARLQKIVCQALQDARNAMDGTKPCGGCGDQ